MYRWVRWEFGEVQMMKSFHLDLSLSRDLELLRVSRLTNANTGKKSDNRHMAGTASRECVSVGFRHTKKDTTRGGVLPWGQS